MPNNSSREVLLALRERVLAAKGADRGIDGRLMAALEPPPCTWGDGDLTYFSGFNRDDLGMFQTHAATPAYEGRRVPAYSASIEAALAFVRRLLPGTMWAVGNMEGGPFCRLVFPREGGFGLSESVEQDGGAKTEPLAVLAALLAALAGAQAHG